MSWKWWRFYCVFAEGIRRHATQNPDKVHAVYGTLELFEVDREPRPAVSLELNGAAELFGQRAHEL